MVLFDIRLDVGIPSTLNFWSVEGWLLGVSNFKVKSLSRKRSYGEKFTFTGTFFIVYCKDCEWFQGPVEKVPWTPVGPTVHGTRHLPYVLLTSGTECLGEDGVYTGGEGNYGSPGNDSTGKGHGGPDLLRE